MFTRNQLGADKDTLVHVFRSLIIAVPGFGNSLERLLFRRDFDGKKHEEIQNLLFDIKALLHENLDNIPDEFKSNVLPSLETNLVELKKEKSILIDEIKESRLKIYNELTLRIDHENCLKFNT